MNIIKIKRNFVLSFVPRKSFWVNHAGRIKLKSFCLQKLILIVVCLTVAVIILIIILVTSLSWFPGWPSTQPETRDTCAPFQSTNSFISRFQFVFDGPVNPVKINHQCTLLDVPENRTFHLFLSPQSAIVVLLLFQFFFVNNSKQR